MRVLEPIARRLRARSVRLLSTAIVFELAGSLAIVYFWPAGWALGLVLLLTATLRVYSLAERTRGAVAGGAAVVFTLVRWLAAATTIAVLVVLLVGALGAFFGSGWV